MRTKKGNIGTGSQFVNRSTLILQRLGNKVPNFVQKKDLSLCEAPVWWRALHNSTNKSKGEILHSAEFILSLSKGLVQNDSSLILFVTLSR